MVTYDTILKDVCQREVLNGCYEIQIKGIDIYNYLKRHFRNKSLSKFGLEERATSLNQSRITRIKSILISFFQIAKILLFNKHFDNCLHSFRRVDIINELYVDKFTDPLIDNSGISESYIIIEAGRNGKHYTPRIHNNCVIYADFFNFLAKLASLFFSSLFGKKNKESFGQLYNKLDKAFPEIEYSRKEIEKTVFYGIMKGRVYSAFYKRIHSKRLIAPSRVDFHVMIPAARKNNMMVVELQHGITYAESLTYSGYQSLMFTPDIFLTFGEMAPKNVYGIKEENIHNIGFAFLDYIKDYLLLNNKEAGGVLLISEPGVTSKMILVTLILAEKYPNITFAFRPHPMEQLSNEQFDRINSMRNIVIDDNTQNIMVSLTQYRHVVGENSTVLYEALSFGCVVGKLTMEGLSPKYLEESDRSFFFEINNVDDFLAFYNCSRVNHNVKHIYSKYNRVKFEELIRL